MVAEKLNLDQVSAKIGFDLAEKNKERAKEFERIVTKALSILVEDGLLAYAIWLESEDESEVINCSFELLKNRTNIIQKDYNDVKDIEKLRKAILEEIAVDIQKTLLARQLLERMLIYARYRAKALQKGSG